MNQYFKYKLFFNNKYVENILEKIYWKHIRKTLVRMIIMYTDI